MKWYLCSIIAHQDLERSDLTLCQAREYWCLFQASSPGSAYTKSLGLGAKLTIAQPARRWILDGLSDLLLVAESPAPDSEILWSERELSPREINTLVRPMEQWRAFSVSGARLQANGWYICQIILEEVHDTGAHGDSVLVWINWHLVEADGPESARAKALHLGKAHETSRNSHRCDGDLAHWEFRGLRDLIPTIDPPGDGATLWFEEFTVAAEELMQLVVKRSDLTVFSSGEGGVVDSRK